MLLRSNFMEKEYTISLDIGTNSVGWAVLTDNYQLIRKNRRINGCEKKYCKKNFWGVRLFDSGDTASGRRMYRTTRRRLARRNYRMNYLRELFFEPMQTVDSTFFNRLNESFLIEEDKTYEKHSLFATLKEEVAYHEKYPTIYHLREKLVNHKEKADLREIYLALAHIIKYRGHFLLEGELNVEEVNICTRFKEFLQLYNQTFSSHEAVAMMGSWDEIESIVKQNISRTEKAEKLLQQFPKEKKTGYFYIFLLLIVGNQGNVKKVFQLDEEAKIQFSTKEYEDNLTELLAKIGDDQADLFETAKKVYESIELENMLTVKNKQTKSLLSTSMVESYQEHQADLAKFKQFIRQTLPEQYKSIFSEKEQNGYAGYIKNAQKVKQTDFYSYIKKIIEDKEGSFYFLEKIKQETFLLKQRTFDNNILPYQVHLKELETILENQKHYYPFLEEKKADIKTLLTFRIPYYIGPLANGYSSFAWLVKKKQAAITPFNYKQVIDVEKSAEKFIERMTNTDTYLPEEKVLPKYSLLYQKYLVFNELTKVSYINEAGKEQNFSSVEKQKIYQELFQVKRRVTMDDLSRFLKNEYLLDDVEIKGIEQKFNNQLSTYHDFLKIGFSADFLNKIDNESFLEDVVKILTVFEDREMIRNRLSAYKQKIQPPILKKLEKKHYTGWGRISAKLINGLYDQQSHKTILDYLMNDDGVEKNYNRNFMQLINDQHLSFKEKITEAQQIAREKMDVGDIEAEVMALAGSPAIKKGIIQSLKIVEELVTILGKKPKNIVIEMARETQTTAHGKKNSLPRMTTLKKNLASLGSALLKQHPVDNKVLQNERLYLYYLQNGRDMYDGTSLDINNLSAYEIDHIIPQSFIKDDSIDNKVLVSKIANSKKLDSVPSKEIVEKMDVFWRRLKQSHLISQRKYDHLTKILRGGLTDDIKNHFIQRQLVETRQITKHVARILDERLNDEGKEKQVQIVTLKAALISQFRQLSRMYKVREINDYHHAHDAYLGGVIALALLKIYPHLAPEFVYGEYLTFNQRKENKATAKKIVYNNIFQFFEQESVVNHETGEILWSAKHMRVIKNVLAKKQINIVKKTEVQTGRLFKETIHPHSKGKLIPIKKGLPTEKYGGYKEPIGAFTLIVEQQKKKKVIREWVKVTLAEKNCFEAQPLTFLEAKGYSKPVIVAKLPKYTLFELANGRRRLLASDNEAQKGNQMVLPQHLVTLLYHAKRVNDWDGKSLQYVEEHINQFEELLQIVLEFAEKYTIAPKNIALIQSLYEENKHAETKKIAESFINLMKFNHMGAPEVFIFFEKSIARRRYIGLKELLEATIVYQSITGLYETRRKLGK